MLAAFDSNVMEYLAESWRRESKNVMYCKLGYGQPSVGSIRPYDEKTKAMSRVTNPVMFTTLGRVCTTPFHDNSTGLQNTLFALAFRFYAVWRLSEVQLD